MGGVMNNWSTQRVTAALAVTGAVVAGVGNGIAPRINGDSVDVYHRIANSTRFAVSGVIVLVAVVLVTAAFVGLTRVRGAGELSFYGRVAAVAGGGLAVLQVGVELYGYRQQAKAFDGANSQNVVSAFWSANALDHISSAMFASWTIVLLGLAPILIGAAQWRGAASSRLGLAAVLGGAVCVVVGVGELLTEDQSKYDAPFAIGSVIVTLWLLITGLQMWRQTDSGPTTPA